MKKITMLLALISLTFAGFSVSTTQNVQAVSKYSEKWHTVKTTEKVYRYKPYVPKGGYMYQMKFIHKTPIKKGTYRFLVKNVKAAKEMMPDGLRM